MAIERFLSAHEVASTLGLDYATVLRYLRSGKLAGTRDSGGYRIAESAVSAFLQSHELLTEQHVRTSPVDRLLTTREVAERLAVDPKTVVRHVKSGRLRGSRIGGVYRIQENSVRALVQSMDGAPPDRRSIVTALINQRAGSGKTSTARGVATALRDQGNRILVIDLDPQASLSSSLDAAHSPLTTSVYQTLLNEDADPADVIRQTPIGIDLLPAAIDLALAEVELVNMMQRELIVRDLVAKIRSRYEHILIDSASNLGLLTINAMAAADQVLIPLPCDEVSLRGLKPLLRTIDLVTSRLNRDLHIAGIVSFQKPLHAQGVNCIVDELPKSFSGRIMTPQGDGPSAYAQIAVMLQRKAEHVPDSRAR